MGSIQCVDPEDGHGYSFLGRCDRGGLKTSGEAWMRIAVAEYNPRNTLGAIAALQKAVNFDESRKQAGEWLRHLTAQQVASTG
jgi:hypothetical protein